MCRAPRTRGSTELRSYRSSTRSKAVRRSDSRSRTPRSRQRVRNPENWGPIDPDQSLNPAPYPLTRCAKRARLGSALRDTISSARPRNARTEAGARLLGHIGAAVRGALLFVVSSCLDRTLSPANADASDNRYTAGGKSHGLAKQADRRFRPWPCSPAASRGVSVERFQGFAIAGAANRQAGSGLPADSRTSKARARR